MAWCAGRIRIKRNKRYIARFISGVNSITWLYPLLANYIPIFAIQIFQMTFKMNTPLNTKWAIETSTIKIYRSTDAALKVLNTCKTVYEQATANQISPGSNRSEYNAFYIQIYCQDSGIMTRENKQIQRYLTLDAEWATKSAGIVIYCYDTIESDTKHQHASADDGIFTNLRTQPESIYHLIQQVFQTTLLLGRSHGNLSW